MVVRGCSVPCFPYSYQALNSSVQYHTQSATKGVFVLIVFTPFLGVVLVTKYVFELLHLKFHLLIPLLQVISALLHHASGMYVSGWVHPWELLLQAIKSQGSLFYDSCGNSVSDPAIFVVFKKHQVYSEYVIEHRDSSTLRAGPTSTFQSFPGQWILLPKVGLLACLVRNGSLRKWGWSKMLLMSQSLLTWWKGYIPNLFLLSHKVRCALAFSEGQQVR